MGLYEEFKMWVTTKTLKISVSVTDTLLYVSSTEMETNKAKPIRRGVGLVLQEYEWDP